METNDQKNIDANSKPPVPASKNGNFLTSLLSILLLLTCIVAGFFAYQTQNLVREIGRLKSTTTTTPSPNPSPELPADWIAYTDNVYGYSIKHPSDWKITPTSSEGYGGVASFVSLDTKLEIGKHLEKIGTDESLKEYFLRTQEVTDIRDEKEIILGNQKVLRLTLPIIHGDSNYKYGIYYTLKRNNEVYFAEFYTDNGEDTQIPDLIVSTIVFDQIKTGCPEDAKLCPDGKSVSRTGPNCEFPSCPKPAQK